MLFIYVTCADRQEAETIARAVIEDGLAACANIFPAHTAIYKWQGEVCSGQETAMILKTTKSNYAALEERVKALHSYEEPCIAGWSAEVGSAGFMGWIHNNTL